jgi:hypothetical protein
MRSWLRASPHYRGGGVAWRLLGFARPLPKTEDSRIKTRFPFLFFLSRKNTRKVIKSFVDSTSSTSFDWWLMAGADLF